MRPRKRKEDPEKLRDQLAGAEVLFAVGLSEAKALARVVEVGNQGEFAAAFTGAVTLNYWNVLQAPEGKLTARKPVVPPWGRQQGLTQQLAEALRTLSKEQAGFKLGQLYTSMLPEDERKQLGAYYTPPPLVSRLLDLVAEAGVGFTHARILDPSCGGSAFLSAAAARVVRRLSRSNPASRVRHICTHFQGWEIDPFASWLSQVLLDIVLLEDYRSMGQVGEGVVRCCNALDQSLGHDSFDLVIGNPPYGRTNLSKTHRQKFEASLFGHANLYGVFTELAVRLCGETGVVGFVTPTSFLGGEYFKKLRNFLVEQAPLSSCDFVSNREGVFEGVLQETMLTVFRRSKIRTGNVKMSLITSEVQNSEPVIQDLGIVTLNPVQGAPWVLPRAPEQAKFVRMLGEMRHRLEDFGYAVSTGQLVWNRHKDQLRTTPKSSCYPIIWAEAVSTNGSFRFQAEKRSHLPFIHVHKGQDWLINHEPCLLVQRTTAKEQRRRLIAAGIPNAFVMEYPGFVVENHLNMIYALKPRPLVALRTLEILFNSPALDQAFRCISGSVAVSAYELEALPLPSPEEMDVLQKAVLAQYPVAQLHELIGSFYRLESKPIDEASGNHPTFNYPALVA